MSMFLIDSTRPHPVAELRETAATLRRLANDLDRLADGIFPTEAELDGAPILTRYQPNLILAPVLCGDVTDHPKLPGIDRTISTSPLWALDADGGWARTYSRLYRLDRPIGESRERMN